MLSDAKIRKAQRKDQPYKLTDEKGLYLHVTRASMVWRMRYERDGKEQTLTIGHYPDIGLARAREIRDQSKVWVRAGLDPAAERAREDAEAKAAAHRTFEVVAREWHKAQSPRWAEQHAGQVLQSLEDHIFPAFGGRPIGAVTAQDVLAAIRAIEARPAIETAHRVRQRVSAAFVYGIAAGDCATDPAAVIKAALAPVVKGRQPALTELAAVRKVLADAEAIPAFPLTRLALRLIALTAVRPGEIRGARVGEFEDLDGPEPLWKIPAERMKMKREHWVPLSRQAVEVVKLAISLIGKGQLLFPSIRRADTPMSENALGYLLNRAGYHGRHVPHGFRASFSSIMNERRHSDAPIVEIMLAHAPENETAAAYNRALYLKQRRELSQEWADLLLHGAGRLSDIVDLPRRQYGSDVIQPWGAP